MKALLRDAVRSLSARGHARPLQRAQRTIAERVAPVLGRLPCVESVYLTGSAVNPARIRPGWSDLDLVLVVRFASAHEELVFLEWASKLQRALHAVLPLFANLDYVEARDLDLLRRHGNAWTSGFDQRWVLLSGREHLDPSRPPRRDALEDLVLLSKRWLKSGALLLDPSEDAAARLEHARRLVLDLAAAEAGVDRHHDPEAVLSLVRASGRDGAELASEPQRLEPWLRYAFGRLESLAKEAAAGWHEPWPLETSAAVSLEGARAPAALGPWSLVEVPRAHPLGGWLLLAVLHEDVAGEALHRYHVELTRELSRARDPRHWWLPRGGVLGFAAWRALALETPAPLVGAASGEVRLLAGSPLPAPPAPPAETLRALIATRISREFVRRCGRPSRGDRWTTERAFQHSALRPMLATAWSTGRFHAPAQPLDRALSPREEVERRWEWLEVHRRALATYRSGTA